MASVWLCMFNVVKHIDDMFAIVKNKVLEQVVGIFIQRAVWTTENAAILLTETLVCACYVVLETIGFALVGKLQVISNGGKVIQYDFYIAILIAVVFGAVLLKVGRENFVDRIFAHNAAKLHKIIETQ